MFVPSDRTYAHHAHQAKEVRSLDASNFKFLMTLIDAQPVSTLNPLLGLPKLIAKDDIYL